MGVSMAPIIPALNDEEIPALLQAAAQAGAVGGQAWQELIVKLTHIAAGLGLIVAWLLLVVGFLRQAPDTGPDAG